VRHLFGLPNDLALPTAGGNPRPEIGACDAGCLDSDASFYRNASQIRSDKTGIPIPFGDDAPHQALIQRDKPQNPAIVAKVNARQKSFGEPYASHTPNQAGRALPGRDRCSAPDKLDAYQNISHATAAGGGKSGTTGSDGVPRTALGLGQRPQSLADAPQLIPPPRFPVPLPPGYLPGVV
jgi:hypothetical protein